MVEALVVEAPVEHVDLPAAGVPARVEAPRGALHVPGGDERHAEQLREEAVLVPGNVLRAIGEDGDRRVPVAGGPRIAQPLPRGVDVALERLRRSAGADARL